MASRIKLPGPAGETSRQLRVPGRFAAGVELRRWARKILLRGEGGVVEAKCGSDTPEQQKAFAENPELFLKYSKMIESELNVRFKFILNGTTEAEGAREVKVLPR